MLTQSSLLVGIKSICNVAGLLPLSSFKILEIFVWNFPRHGVGYSVDPTQLPVLTLPPFVSRHQLLGIDLEKKKKKENKHDRLPWGIRPWVAAIHFIQIIFELFIQK